MPKLSSVWSDLPIEGAKISRFDRHADERGDLTEIWQHNFTMGFTSPYPPCKQINHSRTPARGTIRGMHAQHGLAKLVYCLSGWFFDVLIDLRRDSPTYATVVTRELVPGMAIFVPADCAHGFQTLGVNNELLYICSKTYDPTEEYGVRYDDPAFNVPWPQAVRLVSTRDKNFPRWFK